MECRITLLFVTLGVGVFLVAGSPFNKHEDVVLDQAINRAEPKLAAAIAKYVHMSNVGRFATVDNGDVNIPLPDADYYPGMHMKDIAIIGIAPLSIKRIYPSIKYSHLDVLGRWEYLFVTMTYNDVRIVIKFQDLIGEGLMGMSFDGSTAHVTNTNFPVTFNFLEIKKIENGQAVIFKELEMEREFFRNIQHYFEKNVQIHARKGLEDEVERLLQEFTLEEIFDKNHEVIRKYRSAIQQRDNSVNDLVDFFLLILKGFLSQNHYDQIPAPEIDTPFETKIFGVTVQGSIVAENGKIWNLSSIARTSSFSLDGNLEDDEFTLFGSLGFEKLAAFYEHYKVDVSTFHPEGNLSASIGRNSISLKISGNLKEPEILKIHSYDFRVAEFDDIKVKVSGSNNGIDWLISKIVEWAANFFKGTITNQLEMKVKDMLDKQLESMDWKIPLKPNKA